MNEILEKNISALNFGKTISNKLILNKITYILKLCNYSRMELSDLGFSNDEINEIIIKLQLNGLDLKPNHAKKNTLINNY